MRRKEPYQRRTPMSLGLSLKQGFSVSLEPEMNPYLMAEQIKTNLPGFTELNKKFLCERINVNEKEFDKMIRDIILQKARLTQRGDYSKEFRKFIAEKILEMDLTKPLKERWRRYLEQEEYK